MIVVTAGTAEYRPIIEKQALQCRALGYEHRIYDLGGLGIGQPFEVREADLKPSIGDSLPPATFKPRLLMRNFVPGQIVCWLDGDCLPLRSFEPFSVSDAAVTLRPAAEIEQSGVRSLDYLNSGVVWIRNLDFAAEWLRQSEMLNSDQDGLIDAVAPAFKKRQWINALGKTIITPLGFRVKVLDAMQWNCWHLPPKAETRILHFKRGIRGAAKQYCQ